MKQRRNAAFYVETLLLVLFLLGMLAVLVQMFAAARSQSRQARQLTQATLLAQNAAECFDAAGSPQELALLLTGSETGILWNEEGRGEVRMDGQGTPDAAGPYCLALGYTLQPCAAGRMAQLSIEVRLAGGQGVYGIQAQKYLPGTQEEAA